jgi:hypothetical protein
LYDFIDLLIVCRIATVSVVVIPQAPKKLSVAVSEGGPRRLETFRVDLHPESGQAFLHLQDYVPVEIYEASMRPEFPDDPGDGHSPWNWKSVDMNRPTGFLGPFLRISLPAFNNASWSV